LVFDLRRYQKKTKAPSAIVPTAMPTPTPTPSARGFDSLSFEDEGVVVGTGGDEVVCAAAEAVNFVELPLAGSANEVDVVAPPLLVATTASVVVALGFAYVTPVTSITVNVYGVPVKLSTSSCVPSPHSHPTSQQY
jgi:hypothetical protein